MLVVQPTLARALVAYAASFGFDHAQADVAEEDYVARYTVIVCGRPLTPADAGAELLATYRDDDTGYSFGVVQVRWHDAARRGWSDWEDTAYAVLWTDNPPVITEQSGALREELRIDVRDVAEDAWASRCSGRPPALE